MHLLGTDLLDGNLPATDLPLAQDCAFAVFREESDSVLAIRPGFHLDLAADLHKTAIQMAEASGSVVVDCSQAEHLDGCVVQIMLVLKLALEQRGGSLGMRGASEEIRKYLGWTGLTVHFPLRDPGSAVDPAAAAQPPKRRRTTRKHPL